MVDVHADIRPPVRVLFIDDEEQICNMVRRQSTDRIGYVFTIYTDARAALEELCAGAFDIVVTDIRMPGVTGYDVIREARAYDVFFPIIALTAEAGEPEVEIKCLKEGANYFVPKPFSMDALLAAVDALMQMATQNREQSRQLRKISASRDFLETLLDTIPHPVYYKSIDGMYLECNQAFAESVGEPRDAILGKTAADIYPSHLALVVQNIDQDTVAVGKTRDNDLSAPMLDHSIHDYLCSQSLVHDRDGSVTGIVGVLVDITERKLAEEALRQSEKALNTVFNTVPVGIVVTDEDGRLSRLNKNYCEIYGYKEHELIGQHFSLILHEDAQEQGSRLYRDYLHGNVDALPSEWHVRKKDGSSIDIEASSCIITGVDQRPYVVTALQDVTESNQLRREREVYYEAFRSSVHGITITDAQGKIQHVNSAFEELYGFTQEEALGKTPRILNPGRATYRDLGIDCEAYDAKFGGLWEAILDPARGHWEGDIVNKRKDGSLIWVHLFISSILGEDGSPIAFVGMPMDITAQKKQERYDRLNLYESMAELAEARDNETGMHMRRIGAYSGRVARYIGLGKKVSDDIEVCAPLHDVGKVGIPDSILLAPRKLTDDEFEVIKTHTNIGYAILRDKPNLEVAAEIAYCHHEKWDGSGYPCGLKGDAIPIAARITAIADVYDALRSKRVYKEGWPHAKAAEIIREGSGTHFDPKLVDAFFDLEWAFQEIIETYRDEGE